MSMVDAVIAPQLCWLGNGLADGSQADIAAIPALMLVLICVTVPLLNTALTRSLA